MHTLRYEWRSICARVVLSTGGAPGIFPPATDTCDTLPYDATLDAAPSSLEMVVSPNHDATAKREAYQNQLKKEHCVGESTKDPSQKEAKNSGVSEPNGSEVNEKEPSSGSKAPAIEEKHQMAKTKQTKKKEDEFSESDHEQARFGTNTVSTGIYRFLFVEYMCWGEFYLITQM